MKEITIVFDAMVDKFEDVDKSINYIYSDIEK